MITIFDKSLFNFGEESKTINSFLTIKTAPGIVADDARVRCRILPRLLNYGAAHIYRSITF